MQGIIPLQPTLWRTCRVLANRIRLDMFGLLLRQPNQSVSAVARQLHLALCSASEYLRALEARGLLAARRPGRRVEYRVSSATAKGPAAGLVAALRTTFLREPQPAETVFHLATAFTHPRRIEILRVLRTGPRDLEQIRAATRMSTWALLRHLKKLEARDFITVLESMYQVTERKDALGRELMRLALA